jgi:hypothetical protein
MKTKPPRRGADYWDGPDAENYLSRTVYQPIGVKLRPIGFIHWPMKAPVKRKPAAKKAKPKR